MIETKTIKSMGSTDIAIEKTGNRCRIHTLPDDYGTTMQKEGYTIRHTGTSVLGNKVTLFVRNRNA